MTATTDAKKVLEEVCHWLWPDISRGPARRNWVESMKRIAGVLEWEICWKCNGEGKTNATFPDNCCTLCLNIGKVPPE